MAIPKRSNRALREGYPALGLLVTLMFLGAAVRLHAQQKGEGPATLFVIYQCSPEKRAAFKAHIAGSGVNQFDKWKKQGVFKDYLILFSSYVRFNGLTWDMLVRLDFDRYIDSEKWKAVEATMPGGLSAEALALCLPTATYFTDLAWQNARPSRNMAKAIYVVVGYRAHERSTYARYFQSKVKLDFDTWIEDGALSWYGVYLSQHRAASPWDVIHLLEYTDAVGLARRDVLRQEVRNTKHTKLPSWAFADEQASAARHTEIPAVLADPILPR